MQVVDLHFPIVENEVSKEKIVLALGFFDGIHEGHRTLIKKTIELAHKKGIKAAVMTYNVHPSVVYSNNINFKYLTTIDEKKKIFQELGIDILYIGDFYSELAKLSPKDFIDEVLKKMNIDTVVAGYDYTYGKKEIANMTTFPNDVDGSFQIVEIPEQELNGQKIGSTAIRNALESGNLEQANLMLGDAYISIGEVVHGKQIGRTLGFPTANMKFPQNKIIPAKGIYAVLVTIDNEVKMGMASIGNNVTFGENALTVEINILDFKQDIYGKIIEVQWFEHLRDEVKFDGVDQLIDQLHKDEDTTKEYFEKRGIVIK